ncbi:AAA family ATPase [Yersinia enterocolitica]
MLKYMNLIATLCRFSLKNDPTPDVIKSILKLRDALEKDGLTVEARALSALVDKTHSQKTVSLEDKGITWSKALSPVINELTPSTPLPVDKENSMPLVEVLFPEQIRRVQSFHFFEENITSAIDGILAEWKHADELRDNGILPSYSFLFFGEPGTGKTELAKFFAAKIGLPLVSARLDSLLSSYLGTSARNISTLFDFAEKYNCVLFLDEFDAIAKYRDDSKEVGEIKRVVNTLLQCLDRRKDKGIVIATTNHENLLDPAVWRRFQNKIKIEKPQKVIREKIIKNYYAPMELSQAELSFLSIVLDEFTPSDIKNCIEFIKRFTIINNDSSVDMFKAIKAYFVINANHSNEITKALLLGSEHELAKILVNQHNYSIQDISNLVGKHKSTVSRWIKG